MKLTTFNQTNAKSISRKQPFISFSVKNGVFRFNDAAVELLQLKENSQVEFAQDEEKKSSWFLTVVTTDGFVLKDKKGLSMNSSKMASLLSSSLKEGMKNNSGQILITEVSIEHSKKIYWPLDLSMLK